MSGETENKTTTTVKTVVITPDYKALFQMFMKDFTAQANGLEHLDVDQHKAIHGLLASLNVAMQAVDSVEAFEKFREDYSNIVSQSSDWLFKKECEEWEEPEIDERHGDALVPGADYESDYGFTSVE